MGPESGETAGGRKSAGIPRSPREHAGALKKKGQPRVVDLIYVGGGSDNHTAL